MGFQKKLDRGVGGWGEFYPVFIWVFGFLNLAKPVTPSAVSDYTREAGVRTLERRIAAVCRAVAVRVTEYNARRKSPPEESCEEKMGSLGDSKDAGEVVDVVDASAAISLPPEMPIVIDEHAIEDILGVSWCYYSLINILVYYAVYKSLRIHFL